MFVEFVHFLTYFYQNVNLTRFWEESEFSIGYFNNSSIDLPVIFIKKTSYCKSDTHIFELSIFIDWFPL